MVEDFLVQPDPLFPGPISCRNDLRLSTDAAEALSGLLTPLVAAPGWGNGRDVHTLAKVIYKEHAKRQAARAAGAAAAAGVCSGGGGSSGDRDDLSSGSFDDDYAVSPESLRAALGGMLDERTRAAAAPQPPSASTALLQQFMAQQQSQKAPPPLPSRPSVATAARTEAAAAAPPPPAAATAADWEMVKEEDPRVQPAQREGPPTAAAAAAFDQATESLWAAFPPEFLAAMQDVLQELGLNSAGGVAELLGLPWDSPRLRELARTLAGRVPGLGVEGAVDLLIEWQGAQKTASAAREAQEKEKALAKQ